MRSRLFGTAVTSAALAVLCAPSASAHPAVATQTNVSFAGYSATPKAHITKAKVSFVVPPVTCKRSFSGVGPSIQIDSTVDKKTNSFSVAGGGVGATCQKSQPVYEALVLTPGQTDDAFPVSAGDHITVTVKYGTKTVSTVTDTTSKAHKTDSGKKSVGASAFIGDSGVEISKHNLGLDPFSVTHFTGATINGHSLSKVKAERTNWIDKHKVVLIAASRLSDGKNFTTTFKHSN